VVVSGYSALHLESIFNIRVDGVIRNPLHPIFTETRNTAERRALTFVGRLHRSKKVDKLLPAMQNVLERYSELEAWVIGDGPQRGELKEIYGENSRIKFWGALSRDEVREKLGESRVFISGNPTEPFGIVFLEALSQGCAVVMPASGGGLEIAPDEIGNSIQLFAVSLNQGEIDAAIERALSVEPTEVDLSDYAATEVAKKYLQIDGRFNTRGVYRAAPQVAEVRP
jgi:glycosyltransferase involved in cell wall biosynthesis